MGRRGMGRQLLLRQGRAPIRRILFCSTVAGTDRAAVAERGSGRVDGASFTPFYQSRFVDPVLALLEEMVESVPCYRFQFVPDQSAVGENP